MTAVARPARRAPTTSASRLSIRPADVVGFLAASIILIVAIGLAWVARDPGYDALAITWDDAMTWTAGMDRYLLR